MEVLENKKDLANIPKGCVLTIGNFDGLHVGHQKIFAEAKKYADQMGTVFTVLTFEPHPLAILKPEKAPGILTPTAYKNYLFERYGVDYLVRLKTDRELLKLSPLHFFDDYIGTYIKPKMIVEGDDFNFGSGRAGSIATLKELGKEMQMSVKIISSQQIDVSSGTVRVSSTIVRYMLSNGHVRDAKLALGRPYRLMGKTIPGRGIGRKIGYPTINMEVPDQVIPAEGVYAGTVRLADSLSDTFDKYQPMKAVLSIGHASTFGDNPLMIEAHVLTENEIERAPFEAVDFLERIRNQQAFETKEDLVKQISKDCRKAIEILR